MKSKNFKILLVTSGTVAPFSDRSGKLVPLLFKTAITGDFDIEYYNFLEAPADIKSAALKELIDTIEPSRRLNEKIAEEDYDVIFTFGSLVNKLHLGISAVSKYQSNVVRQDGLYIPVHSPAFYAMNDKVDALAIRLYSGIRVAMGDDTIYQDVKTPFEYILTLERLNEVLDDVEEVGIFCHDYETNAKPWWDDDAAATMLSFAYQPGYGFVIPLTHPESKLDQSLIPEIFKLLEDRVFANTKVIKIAQNLWYEANWHMKYGVTKFFGEWHDTMLMSQIDNELSLNGLKANVITFFPAYAGYEMDMKRLAKEGYTWANYPMEQLATYGTIDSDMTLRLWMHFEHLLMEDDEEHKLYLLYRNFVMPAFWALVEMSHRGMKLDLVKLKEARLKIEPEIEKLYTKLCNYDIVKGFMIKRHKEMKVGYIKQAKENIDRLEAKGIETGKDKSRFIANWENRVASIKNGTWAEDPALVKALDFEFNPGSVPQMREILYLPQFLALDKKLDERTGEFELTTSRAWVQQFNDPFITDWLVYKFLQKISSTNLKALDELVDKYGFIHGDYNICGTRSGRGSSRRPNLQNLTKHNWFSQNAAASWAVSVIRDLFINLGDGWEIKEADFAQMELMLIANFSHDAEMRKAFTGTIDIHTKTSAAIEGLDVDAFVAKKDDPKYDYKFKRTTGKMSNFALVYGISWMGYRDYIFKMTGTMYSKRKCESHIRIFFETYPNLNNWHNAYNNFALKHEYVRTLFGRKRRFPGLSKTNDSSYRSACMRQSINSPIQGTSGELTLFLFALASRVLPRTMYKPMNTVHDSLFAYQLKVFRRFICSIIDSMGTSYDIARTYFVLADEEKLALDMKLDYSFSDESWYNIKEVDHDETVRALPGVNDDWDFSKF